MTAVTGAKRISTAKNWNQAKGWAVLLAQSSEVLAVGALAVGVFEIVRST